MNSYSTNAMPKTSHSFTVVSLILGTLIGVICVAVTSLFVFIVYAFSRPEARSEGLIQPILVAVLVILGGVVVGIPAMWVLFFTRHDKDALIVSLVPVIFATVEFIAWQVLTRSH